MTIITNYQQKLYSLLDDESLIICFDYTNNLQELIKYYW